MHSFTVPTSLVGAGRQPLAPIHNRSSNIDVADDLKGLLDLQVADAIETPVATSPVPVPVLRRVRTINRLEGLSILERRNAHLAREDFIITFPLADHVQDPSLKRVRTINKQEGLTMLERRRARFTEGSATSAAQTSSLKRVRTINKQEGLAMLECRRARFTEDSATSLAQTSSLKRVRTINKQEGLAMLECRRARFTEDSATSVAQTSSLKRVRTINKQEGLTMLERRRARSTGDSATSLAQASSLKRVRTINKLAGMVRLEKRKRRNACIANVNADDMDVPEDGEIAYAMWMKLKEARLARQNSAAMQSKARSVIGKLESLVTAGRRVARFAKDMGDSRPQAFILERVRTLYKLAGLGKREHRKAQVVVKQSVQTYFDPECPNHLLTPPPLVRKANIEDPDISEDAKIAFALWLKKRVEAAENSLAGL